MSRPRKIRWKTLLVGLALPAIALLGARTVPAISESMYRSALSVLCLLVAVLWTVLWVLLVSGARWRTRGLVLVAFAAVGGLLAGLLRLDGYEGDIYPQLAWVWEPRPGEVYDELDSPAESWRSDVPGALDSREFLGPDGGGYAPADALPERWFETGPRELWRRKVGLGWSSFAVAAGLAITQEQRGDEEHVVAYALESGAPVWAHANRARFSEEMGGDGPRATPTIAGDLVFALGATGILDALELETGELQWTRDVLGENGHGNLSWGKSASPLVARDLVVVTLGNGSGGTLAAYDRKTGEPRWRAGEFKASYATPVLRELAGAEQIVVVYDDHLAGHRVETGEVLWSVEIPSAPANVANAIVVPPNRVLVAIGYGKGARLFEIRRDGEGPFTVEMVWRSLAMKPKFTNPVRAGDFAFGLDEGILACVDLRTGRRVWKGSRFGHGQVLGVGDHLIVQAEDGDVAFVEISTEGERVLSRFEALEGKTWNQPALAGRYLLVRNDREAACYAFPELEPPGQR